MGEVGLDDRGVLAVGVDARPFPERVLQILDQVADVVRRAHRSLRLIVQSNIKSRRRSRHLGGHHAQVARVARRLGRARRVRMRNSRSSGISVPSPSPSKVVASRTSSEEGLRSAGT